MSRVYSLKYVGGPKHGQFYLWESGQPPRTVAAPGGLYVLRGATLEWRAAK